MIISTVVIVVLFSSELWGPKRLLNSPRLILPEPETFTSAKRRCSWWAVDRGLYVSTSLSNSTRDRVSSFGWHYLSTAIF